MTEREKIGCLVIIPDKKTKQHGNAKSIAWQYFGKLYYDPQQAQLQSANTGRTASASCSSLPQQLQRAQQRPMPCMAPW